jgi:hypothetical protein
MWIQHNFLSSIFDHNKDDFNNINSYLWSKYYVLPQFHTVCFPVYVPTGLKHPTKLLKKNVYFHDRCTPVLAIGDQYDDDATHTIVIIICI